MNLSIKIRGLLNFSPASLTNYKTYVNPEEVMTQYLLTGKKQYLIILVKEFNATLYHYLLSQSDKVTAEDVIQTTWLKVMRTNTKIQKGVFHTHVKSWLFTIARNTLIDELRKQNKWQYVELEDQLNSNQTLEQLVEHEDKLIQFNQALLALPFLQREAFILQQEGFSIEEIGELTAESFEAIKSRLRYARNHFKKCLGGES